MSITPETSLKVRNYKSFGGQPQGFEKIMPINIIIGRNNSGKSSLIDIIPYAIGRGDISRSSHNGHAPEVQMTGILSESTINYVFPASTSGGAIDGNWNVYGRQFIGKALTVALNEDGSNKLIHLDQEPPDSFHNNLANQLDIPFNGKQFRRVLAERNVMPEDSTQDLTINPDGSGVTNLIQHMLNDSVQKQSLVERNLLDALNKIFYPDSKFVRIQTKRLDHERNMWEIYLEEEHKGTIPLSNSGSGLKTVIQVLCETIISPSLEGKPLADYIYGLEELENNLHPGLLRRLYDYLRELAVNESATFFITTHSNVVIDLFSSDDQAQLLHVTHDGSEAIVRTLTDHNGRSGVLDDLDVRASDILQANSIIWVEGPSDRVYMNHFISLISDGKIREGAAYQTVFYGGRLLARITAEAGNGSKVNLLSVNRHASIIIDSDRRSARGRINATKQRLRSEVENVGGYAWVTDGKEIENYIPVEALRAYYNMPELEPIGQYELFNEYLDNIKDGEGEMFLRNKVLYAENIIRHITVDMIRTNAILLRHIDQLVTKVSKWNRLGSGV